MSSQWSLVPAPGLRPPGPVASLTQLCSDVLLQRWVLQLLLVPLLRRVVPPSSWAEQGCPTLGLEALCQTEILVQVVRGNKLIASIFKFIFISFEGCHFDMNYLKK